MITPVVESVVRVGLVRKESAPTRADSMSDAEFKVKRRMVFYAMSAARTAQYAWVPQKEKEYLL
jgi:hypothetical protein